MRLSPRNALPLLLLALPGCDLVGDVVEVGLWTVLIGVVVVALLIYAVIKVFFD